MWNIESEAENDSETGLQQQPELGFVESKVGSELLEPESLVELGFEAECLIVNLSEPGW